MGIRRRISEEIRELWQTSWPLTGTGILMLALFVPTAAAVWLDPRLIMGAPAWLKPAKFAISTAIFMLTMAWMLKQMPGWRRLTRVVGVATAFVFLLEIPIIYAQAWRGTTSHFNIGTPLDATLFAVMGSAILLQTLMTAAVAIAMWRERFADRALGWALRLGLAISIVGASTGGLMTRPTAAQLEAAAVSRPTVIGAHTVGAPDGGPGLPGTNWSLEHGDIRVAHFTGLHAMQVIPLMALWLLRRRVDDVRRVRLVLVAAASYASVFVILLTQALRGQSFVQPDSLTAALFAAWALATVAGLTIAARTASHRGGAAWMTV